MSMPCGSISCFSIQDRLDPPGPPSGGSESARTALPPCGTAVRGDSALIPTEAPLVSIRWRHAAGM